LSEAIEAVDEETGAGPLYYMINCAHPTHFAGILESGSPWIKRLRGVRANASRRSHAELDNAPELDTGDPQELGEQYADLLARFPHINVLGGCCGTDHRHIEAIAERAVLQIRKPPNYRSRFAKRLKADMFANAFVVLLT
jgi:S-methylmethionine-dependent homocysteine/selenocysteine methylase